MTDLSHPSSASRQTPNGDAGEPTLGAAVAAFLAAYDEPKAAWADVEMLVPAMRAALAEASKEAGGVNAA